MKSSGPLIAAIILLILMFTQTGCQVSAGTDSKYKIPVQLNDGLQTGDAAAMNIDTELLEDAVKAIQKGKYNEVHSMLIYKNNKLVMEEYFEGYNYQWDAPKYQGELVKWDSNKRHPVMSCTKSVTSACIAIAIEKGFIGNVHQSIFDYLPEHQQLRTNNRNYITIEHLLTMTSGLAWNEWSSPHGGDFTNDIDHLYTVDDQISAVLEREWWAEPGQFFTYNGGGMVILGEIIKNASGIDIEEFSNTYLFEPLGIEATPWMRYKNGRIESAGSLSFTPRSMIKFGACYLNNGVWNNQQVIPADWIVKSSEPYGNNHGIKIPIEDSGENGYGYSWWTSEMNHRRKAIKMYRANGWGGQVIQVLPELDMVVVFTGGNYVKKSRLFKLTRKYILPAVLH
ncbi:serine hydrolase [Maribellus sp. YY47]|uniref:serine hydrolase domain-containing protein n=1 Tax=Maribellus sp. YY47 TaxID=2929486 RepID=UPI002001A40F|nr:serine hydrolase [Maribellus sp. YY47]MCK3684127.1 beta-lactamase family protein [Maribellus sp. YY47]